MTIEALLECSADELEKMSDAELLNHFTPFLMVTRPDLAMKERAEAKTKVRKSEYSDMELEAMKIAKQYGLDLKL